MKDNDKEKTIGESITEALEKAMESYSKVLTDIFVYSPTLLNTKIKDYEQQRDNKEGDTKERL